MEELVTSKLRRFFPRDPRRLGPQQQTTPTFDRKLALIVRVGAINLTGLLYVAVLLLPFGLSASSYKLALFCSVLTVIPALSTAAAHRYLRDSERQFVVAACEAVVVAVAILFVAITVLIWLSGATTAAWAALIRAASVALVCAHAGLLLTGRLPAVARTLGRLSLQATWVALAVTAAMLIAFRIEPQNPLLNVLFGFVLGLNHRPSLIAVALCATAAGLTQIGARWLLRQETEANGSRLALAQRIALALAVAAVAYFYFDYTFDSDVLHYLTNVAPATQIIHADTVPMVTAFSQYGPGPMSLTWLTFLITAPSFHAANILAQLHSLAFYAVVLLCLSRMTPYRMSALVLGFFAVGVVLAGWGGGNGNLNTVPSSIGMRYLPNALLVLAISFLPCQRTFSWGLFSAVTLSALWSFETLIGSAGIAGLFLLTCAVRNRDPVVLMRGIFLSILLPIAAATLLTAGITLLWAGALPDYAAYLTFALIYNPVSGFWSLAGSGAFLGWVPVATAVMVALTMAWLAAIDPARTDLPAPEQVLIYRVAPMAGLTGFMSSYFVGRSVDFTLIIAFLPFAALAIPPLLTVFRESMTGRKELGIMSAFVLFLALTFSFTVLYRPHSPYSTAVTLCLHDGVCSPFRLAAVAKERYALQPMLDQAANPNFYDTSGLAREAIELIEKYAPDRRRIVLLLGIHPATIWSVHTNTVLVLAGKGHRWPISYILSDEINPVLHRAILNADVTLEPDEIVFVRKDETRLGPLEAAILTKIRSSVRLCPLPSAGDWVAAYRATRRLQCDAVG